MPTGIYKPEIRKKILNDPDLFAAICSLTGKNAYAAAQMVNRNTSKELKDFNIVNTIKQYTGKSERMILTDVTAIVKNK